MNTFIETYDSLLGVDMPILKRVEKALSLWTNGISDKETGITKIDRLAKALCYLYRVKKEKDETTQFTKVEEASGIAQGEIYENNTEY